MSIRYVIISYEYRGFVWYRVVDTFNGSKVMRNGISNEQDAKDYADSLNDDQARIEARNA